MTSARICHDNQESDVGHRKLIEKYNTINGHFRKYGKDKICMCRGTNHDNKSSLLYGCVTSNMTDRRKGVEVVVRHETIKERMAIERTSIQDIGKKQLIWYGHINRMSQGRLSRMTMDWQLPEKRKRAKPKAIWGLAIKREMSARNLQLGQWNSRKEWNLGTG